jgi:hypothetical protein
MSHEYESLNEFTELRAWRSAVMATPVRGTGGQRCGACGVPPGDGPRPRGSLTRP